MPSSPLCIRVVDKPKSKETGNRKAGFRLLTATMTIDSSARVKNQVRDSIEQGFDSMHRVADAVTFPFAAVDGAIHGVARGVLNWLTDTHPEDRKKKCKPGHAAPPPPPNPYYSAPAPPPAYAQSYPYAYNYGYPPPPPPPPGPPPPQCQNNPGYLFYEKQQSRTSPWTSSDSNGYYPGRPGN